jgi:putative ABC transport system ATP-binding protein
MTVTAAVRVRALSRTFPGRVPVRALVDVSFDLLAGTLTVVEGPSGSGKSTLLSLIGGLDRPTAGSVSIFGRELSGLPERQLLAVRRADVGFVFQDFKLLDVISAADNVALALRLRGARAREARRRSHALLDELGLDGRVGAFPGDLSGGEKQRVAIARALVTQPRLVLADEPTANLDGATGGAVIDLLRDATRVRGTTVVVVSHDLRVSARADLVLHVLDGRLRDIETREAA